MEWGANDRGNSIELDGQLFISMPCYEGDTLRDKIGRGPLEIDDAVNVILQICEALKKSAQKWDYS